VGKSNNKLIAHETFTDGEAMKAHIEKAQPLLSKLMTGPGELEKFEVHGPEPEARPLPGQVGPD
jgi:quinol monooxygenase YgiN